MGDLATQQAGLEALIKQVLDRMTDLDTKVDGLQGQLLTTSDRADRLEARLEAAVPPHQADGKAEAAGETEKQGSRAADSDREQPVPQVAAPRGAALSRPSATTLGSGSMDRRDDHLRRGDARGLFGSPPLAPGAGTYCNHRTLVSIPDDPGDPYAMHDYQHRTRPHATPKMDFPKFDGENPKLWQQECETYFELYQVLPGLRTRYASLNFKGTAALWLRNVQAKGRVENWDELCNLVHEKFGKNKYTHYRRQLRQLKQVDSVAIYVEAFEKLRNQLLLYNPALDESFFC